MGNKFRWIADRIENIGFGGQSGIMIKSLDRVYTSWLGRSQQAIVMGKGNAVIGAAGFQHFTHFQKQPRVFWG
jgi:hypothetical protein